MALARSVVFAAVLLAAPYPAAAQDVAPDKRVDIEKLLEMTGAMRIGQALSQTMVAQLTAAVRAANPSIPDQLMDVLPEEVNAVLAENAPAFVAMAVRVYDKYYSAAEVKALIAFYATPIGRKVIAVTPSLAQESMQIGIQWGQSLGPEIDRRIRARFRKEGVKL
jgi:hypothetical protein